MKFRSDSIDQGAGSAHRQLLTRAAWIAILSLSVKLVAMGKDIVLARSFGAGRELDAFLVALMVPLFAWAVVSQSFSSAFIPVLVDVRQNRGAAGVDDLIRAMFGKVIIALALLTAALACGGSWFLPVIAGGFSAEQIVLTQRLFNILVWIVPLSGVSTFCGAILNASSIFVPAALAPIVIPLSMLVALLVFVPQWGLDMLAWGVVAGYATEFALLVAIMRVHKMPIGAAWRNHPQVTYIFRQYGYLLVGALLMSSSTIIDQSMATWLGPGSVSALSYGYKLVAVLLGTMSVGISTAVFPHFSQLVARNDGPEITKTLYSLCRTSLLAAVPLTAALIVFSEPIAKLAFQHGAVTAQTVAAISTVQICYLLQVPVFVLGVLGARLLHALGRTRTLLGISAINLMLNVIGNLIFVKLFGVAGIALSTSCMYLISTTLVFIALRPHLSKSASLKSFAVHSARAA